GQQQATYRPATPTAAERAPIDRHQVDEQEVYRLDEALRTDQAVLEHDREAYRTALEAHQQAAELGRAYRRSEARLEADQRALSNARMKAEASAPAAASAERAIAGRAEHRNTHLRRNV